MPLNLQILELRCKRALSRFPIKQFDPDEKLYCIGWQFRVKKLVDGSFDQKHLYKSQNQGIVFLPNDSSFNSGGIVHVRSPIHR